MSEANGDYERESSFACREYSDLQPRRQKDIRIYGSHLQYHHESGRHSNRSVPPPNFSVRGGKLVLNCDADLCRRRDDRYEIANEGIMPVHPNTYR